MIYITIEGETSIQNNYIIYCAGQSADPNTRSLLIVDTNTNTDTHQSVSHELY
jgi:hypothetical protein